MKAKFPEAPIFLEVFKNLPPIFSIERRDGEIILFCPTKLEVKRGSIKTSLFYNIYKQIRVEGGRKIWNVKSIILEPEKPKSVNVGLSQAEYELLKAAAKKAKKALAEYVREAAFHRATADLGVQSYDMCYGRITEEH